MGNILLQKAQPPMSSSWGTSLAHKTHTAASLQKILDATEHKLIELKNLIIEARASNTLDMPCMPHAILRLNKYTYCFIYTGPYDEYISDLSLLSIDSILAHNNDTASLLSSGINESSLDAIDKKTVYIFRQGSDTIGAMHKYVLVKPKVCSICKDVVTHESMEDHMKTVACLYTKALNGVESRGMVILDHDLELDIIRTEGIPLEYHPSGFNIFIPAWVEQAIKTYNSLTSRGGFQDITLTEYLTMLARPK